MKIKTNPKTILAAAFIVACFLGGTAIGIQAAKAEDVTTPEKQLQPQQQSQQQPQQQRDPGFMGVGVDNISAEAMKRLGLEVAAGTLVIDVVAESSAEAAGLQKDDVILAVNDIETPTVQQFMQERMKFGAGDEMMITLVCEGTQQDVKLTLKPMPQQFQPK